jgi:hypothetical protein
MVSYQRTKGAPVRNMRMHVVCGDPGRRLDVLGRQSRASRGFPLNKQVLEVVFTITRRRDPSTYLVRCACRKSEGCS